MNKKMIFIPALIVVLVILYYAFGRKKEEEVSTEYIDNRSLLDLINDYDSITDYNKQITVWREMFKNCSFWISFLTQEYNSDENKSNRDLGQTIDDQYTLAAINYIEKGKAIQDAYFNCKNSVFLIHPDFYNGTDNWRL